MFKFEGGGTSICDVIYVTDGMDRTSSMPSSVLCLCVDKGQDLQSGIVVSINCVLPVQ